MAVLAVIAFHLNFGWASGGLLGVQVFFVLSGYLITDLLMAEYSRHRGIGLKMFWLRRARRLLPALLVMLFVTVGWATLFDRAQLGALRSDLVPGIFYYSNWWFIFQHVSYFAKFGPPSPLGHLWSLAIEEQFYLLWPLLILLGFRFLHAKRTMLLVTLGLAAASAIEMGILFSLLPPNGDTTRIYDGTDTRAFALLIGAALAMALPRNRTFAPVSANARRLLNGVGGLSLLGILVMYWHTNQYEPFLYQGGMVLLAILTAMLIAVTVHPGSQMRTVLGWEPLRWVGERSYAIYLWHYPIIVLTTPLNAGPSLVRDVLQIAATLVIAALSWRYIEQPVRHGALGRQWEKIRSHQWRWPTLRPVGWVVVCAVALNTAICALGLFVVSASAADPGSQITTILTAPRHHRTTPTTVPGHPVSTVTTTTVPPPAGQGVTAIGDSIMVDAAPYLQEMLPGIAVDAQVGQQLYQVQDAVPQLKQEGIVGNRLILELGTNGPYSVQQMEQLINSLGPMRKIVLVNTRVPRPWQEQVNQTIAAVAQAYPQATVVNWYADSATHPTYFYPDGVHLDPPGAKYYASLLAQAVQTPPPSPVKNRAERGT